MALIRIEHFSSILGMNMGVDVILPEVKMDDVENHQLCDIPTMYLLHGTGDNHTNWQRMSSIERYAMQKKIAVIMPTTHIGAYANQQCGPMRYYDYVSKELPCLCETYFPITKSRDKRCIAGLSMGGYGALKLGLREPGFYGHIIALSSVCNRLTMLPKSVCNFKSIDELVVARKQLNNDDYVKAMHFYANFGSAAHYNQSYENNLFLIAKRVAESGTECPEIFMCCGYDDELALQSNRDFSVHLDEMKIPHFYIERPGAHEWDFWDTHIKSAIDWLPDFSN